MQLVGLAILVAGYAGVYKAAQMLKRPAGGTAGSFLYWLTGVESLGAPSGAAKNAGAQTLLNAAPGHAAPGQGGSKGLGGPRDPGARTQP